MQNQNADAESIYGKCAEISVIVLDIDSRLMLHGLETVPQDFDGGYTRGHVPSLHARSGGKREHQPWQYYPYPGPREIEELH